MSEIETSWKDSYIAKHGEDAYERRLIQNRAWNKAHLEERRVSRKKWKEKNPEQVKASNEKYREEHPEEVIASNQESCRKGGRYYNKKLEYEHTGVPGERNRMRYKHGREWKPYKDIIAPDSQIHHEWVPGTAEYRGVALVEADQHMHGVIDVIRILDGEITLFTEKKIREQETKNMRE